MRLTTLLSVLLILAADQISKWWVVEHIVKLRVMPDRSDVSAMPFLQWLTTAQQKMPYTQIDILPFFNLVMVWNKGISFGIFNNTAAHGPYLLTALSRRPVR